MSRIGFYNANISIPYYLFRASQIFKISILICNTFWKFHFDCITTIYNILYIFIISPEHINIPSCAVQLSLRIL